MHCLQRGVGLCAGANTAPAARPQLPQLLHPSSRPLLAPLRAAETEDAAPAAASSQPATGGPEASKRPSPLERGGTKAGAEAAGKDASPAAKAKFAGLTPTAAGTRMQVIDGFFKDERWIDGRWDLSQFAGADGSTDWDKVIDVEIARRKLLEDTPIASRNEDPVNFDTSEIPWWAWVKRFHLPEAEKLNGRAAMVGYFLAIFVDKFTGHGLLEQQNSFLGLLALHISVFGILAIRQNSDLKNFKSLFQEATFYDRQWNATWDGIKRPSEKN